MSCAYFFLCWALAKVLENGLSRWPRRLVPFTDMLEASGYETALFGKAGFMPLPPSLRPLPDASGDSFGVNALPAHPIRPEPTPKRTRKKARRDLPKSHPPLI